MMVFEGVEVVKNNLGKYDLVLLDLIMPKKDGISVLEEIKDFTWFYQR